MRRFLNNYQAAVTTTTVLDADLSFDVDIAPPSLSAGEYYILTLTDSLTAPMKIEIVKATAVTGSTLTIERAQEDTAAQGWAAGDTVHLADTASAFETLDGAKMLRYAEAVATATSATIDRKNGGIQSITLTADTSFLWLLSEGENIKLYVTPSGFNVDSWGVDYIMTDVPVLATESCVMVEKKGGLLYMWDGGSRS